LWFSGLPLRFGVFLLGSYRSRLDIIADILRAVSQNAKKTQIMYQAKLSYKILTKYLYEVSRASLIIFVEEKQCYQLTDKGQKFLETYRKYSKYNRHVEERLTLIKSQRKILEALCSSK